MIQHPRLIRRIADDKEERNTAGFSLPPQQTTTAPGRFKQSLTRYLALVGVYLLGLIVLKVVELLVLGEGSLEARIWVHALVYNLIVASWEALALGILYFLIRLLSERAAMITAAILYALLLLSETGLTLYVAHNGFLLGCELAVRPFNETLMAIKGAMGVVVPLVLVAVLTGGITLIALWRAKRPTPAVWATAMVVGLLIVLSLIFKMTHLVVNNYRQFILNKTLYLVPRLFPSNPPQSGKRPANRVQPTVHHRTPRHPPRVGHTPRPSLPLGATHPCRHLPLTLFPIGQRNTQYCYHHRGIVGGRDDGHGSHAICRLPGGHRALLAQLPLHHHAQLRSHTCRHWLGRWSSELPIRHHARPQQPFLPPQIVRLQHPGILCRRLPFRLHLRVPHRPAPRLPLATIRRVCLLSASGCLLVGLQRRHPLCPHPQRFERLLLPPSPSPSPLAHHYPFHARRTAPAGQGTSGRLPTTRLPVETG